MAMTMTMRHGRVVGEGLFDGDLVVVGDRGRGVGGGGACAGVICAAADYRLVTRPP